MGTESNLIHQDCLLESAIDERVRGFEKNLPQEGGRARDDGEVDAHDVYCLCLIMGA